MVPSTLGDMMYLHLYLYLYLYFCCCRYGNWDELKLLLSRHMQCSDNVLLLGPGACTLHEQLYDCGWRALTVVDSCKAALEAWKTRSTVRGSRPVCGSVCVCVGGGVLRGGRGCLHAPGVSSCWCQEYMGIALL